MNDNFPSLQLEIVAILEQKYNIDPMLISRIYLPFFLEKEKAENILTKIKVFERQSKNLNEAKFKITDLFGTIITQNFLNDKL